MNNKQEQDTAPQIGDICRWDGERWKHLTGPEAAGENQEAYAAIYDLLNSLDSLDEIETADIAIPGSAEVWRQAIKQGFQRYNQIEELMERWGDDLNSATIREQKAQSEDQP